MSRTQNRNHRIGTYEINWMSLSYFDDKIYIQNNGCVSSRQLFSQAIKFEKSKAHKKEFTEELKMLEFLPVR